MLTDILLVAVLTVVVIILLLLIWQARKLSDLARKEADWALIVNKLAAIQQGQEQVDLCWFNVKWRRGVFR